MASVQAPAGGPVCRPILRDTSAAVNDAQAVRRRVTYLVTPLP
jgi:hypothetical protein